MAHNDEVKLHFLDYWRVVRIRWPLVLLAFLLVLVTAAVITYFQPREYQSFVFIEVRSTAENPRIFGQGDPNLPIHDPQLAPTVYQVIQRTGILYPVIEQLKLQEKWGRDGRRPSREAAYQILRHKLDVDEVRNTDLLQISVFDPNPQLAADIANKIVSVYQDRRVEEEKEILNRATGEHEHVDFGNVGDVVEINTRLLTVLLDHGYLPVISSLGADAEGTVFNINADTIAAEIAVQLKAEKLILLTDVDGIYLQAGEPTSKLSRLTAAEANDLITKGTATGGMIPKLQSITELLRRGVHSAHIISGTKRNALLSEIFTDKGTGTMIVA